MTGTIHEHMIGNELAVVLVGRRHIDFVSGFFAHVGERADDVIRLETGDFENGYIHRLEELLDDGNRLADVFRGLGALGFVLLVRLVAEGTSCRVKSHP